METNKQILLDIAKRLDESMSTNWSSGDVSQWADHAKRMKTTIASITPILKTIANSETPITKKQKVIFTDAQSHIEKYLEDGWLVKSVTPLSVSTQSRGRGEYCFVLEK